MAVPPAPLPAVSMAAAATTTTSIQACVCIIDEEYQSRDKVEKKRKEEEKKGEKLGTGGVAGVEWNPFNDAGTCQKSVEYKSHPSLMRTQMLLICISWRAIQKKKNGTFISGI